MYKACSRCGKIHSSKYKCNVGRVYNGGEERQLRNTNAWHKKAEEIKERSSFLCAACREEGIYTYDGLEVHHIVKVKDDPSLLLDDSNLVCLCVKHHKLADRGEISGEKLNKWVNERDGRYPPYLS